MPLQPPPRDQDGRVIPHNHQDILPDDWVIRRISERLLIDDPKTGGKRISSIAFKPSSGPNGGMSVDLQRPIEEAGYDARAYVTESPFFGSVRLQVRPLRQEAFLVGYEPSKRNPYHGEVWGNFTTSRQRTLKNLCEWFVPIAGVAI